jgi:hypothetical protein
MVGVGLCNVGEVGWMREDVSVGGERRMMKEEEERRSMKEEEREREKE